MPFTNFEDFRKATTELSYDELKLKLLDQYSKIALVTSNDEVIFSNKLNHKNFTFNVCNEIILTVPIVFYLQKNSYLTEIFNEKIDALKSAGLIDYWISKYLDPKYYKPKINERDPTKLKFRELLGAFQLLAFGAFCASLSFVFEIGLKFYCIVLNFRICK